MYVNFTHRFLSTMAEIHATRVVLNKTSLSYDQTITTYFRIIPFANGTLFIGVIGYLFISHHSFDIVALK